MKEIIEIKRRALKNLCDYVVEKDVESKHIALRILEMLKEYDYDELVPLTQEVYERLLMTNYP